MQEQSEVLQMATQGKPLPLILERLTIWAEKHSPKIIAAIFLADDLGKKLYHIAGANLPADYRRVIDGLPIKEGAEAVGTAAFLMQRVIVENIAESALFRNQCVHALSHQLCACFAVPIINEEGRVRGTFALYYRESKKPSENDLQLLSIVSHVALLAIEYKMAELERRKSDQHEKLINENLKKSEQRFQNLVREATIGIIVLRGEEMIVDVVNDTYGHLVNRKIEELIHQPLFDVIPETEESFRPILENIRLTGEPLYLYDYPYFVFVEGEKRTGYLNLVYQAYKEFDGTITGVMVLCHDVTEVVLSRKKLEESEANFRNLVLQAPVAIAVFKGDDFVAEVANDFYLPIVGKSREEFVGKPLFETLPETKDVLEPLARELVRTGNAFSADEFEININRNGRLETCYFNSIWKPYYELDGKINGFIVVANEITDQVVGRRKIEESEQRVRSFVDAAPFPIGVYVGREMRIQFANQSILDTWGKGNDVIGKLYAEILPELDNQQIFQQLDSVYTTGFPYHAKSQRVDIVIDGLLQPFYFNYSFTPLFDSEGKVYGVMNTAANVTELALVNKNLEDSEERARLAIEASEQGTLEIDLVTNRVVSSRRMAEIFDVEYMSEREAFINALHPDDLEIRERAYQKAFETSILAYDGRVVKKDKTIRWIRVKGKVYYNEENKPVRLFGVIQDISEHKVFAETLAKKVEERTAELELANRQLAAMNDELQQFAYVASHDLQEPLRKIRTFSDWMSRYVEPESEAMRYLGKINASAERMSGLINSLLEYSKLTAGGLRFEKVDLNQLIKSVLTDYELLISQKDAKVSVSVLPVIDAIPLQMNQLFYNLIGNALKFTRRGVQPVIEINAEILPGERKTFVPELELDKEYVEISVKDNGIGFDQNYAKKIFTVFQRLNDRSQYGGYGIGLALCKKVTQTHRGLIHAEGRLKEGAKFTIILPVKQTGLD